MYNGNENITICDHPLIKHKITMLRNKETGTNEFRTIVEELSMLIGYGIYARPSWAVWPVSC